MAPPESAGASFPPADANPSATSLPSSRRIVGPGALGAKGNVIAVPAGTPPDVTPVSPSERTPLLPAPDQSAPRRVGPRSSRYVKVSDDEYFDPAATPEARREAAVTREMAAREQLISDRQRAARDEKAANERTKIDARAATYEAAGLTHEEAAAAAQSPALARSIFFPPTAVHSANRDYDNTHPAPRRVGVRSANPNAVTPQDREAARVTALATTLTKPTRGSYGTMTPGLSWNDALAEATRRITAAKMAVRTHSVESGDADPDAGGDIDLNASAPASAPPRVGPPPAATGAPAPVGARRIRQPGGAASQSAQPATPARSAAAAAGGASIAQRAYDLIASGQSTVESARQKLHPEDFAALQQLLQGQPIGSSARPR